MISSRFSKRRLTAMVTLTAAMMMAAALYGAWQLSRSRDFQLLERSSRV